MTAKWTDYVAGAVLTAANLNDTVDNFQDIAIFNETQAQNTNGGTPTATTFTKRTLNTTVVNNITSCTLTSSVIALPAGTFFLRADAPLGQHSATTVDANRHRIQNTTAATTIQLSGSMFNGGNTASNFWTSIVTVFTLSVTSNIELQYYVTNAIANTGLGRASNITGLSEIYSQVMIARIA